VQYFHPILDFNAILSSNFGFQVPAVPPHVVSHMMVSLKTMRAVVPSTFQQDDIDDMSIYSQFAGRLDPQNPESDNAQ